MTKPRPRHRAFVLAALLAVTTLPLAGTATAQTLARGMAVAALPGSGLHSPELPLGLAGLPETRDVRSVAPGVSLTTIHRGVTSADDFWTIGIGIPTGAEPGPNPDPDAPTAVLGTRERADAVAAQLASRGWTPRVEAVDGPQFDDVDAGLLGYIVRVGRYAERATATAESSALSAAGFRPSVIYTAHDGRPTTGPWVVRVLTIDWKRFSGRVESTYGAYVTGRESTTAMARAAGALAAVNGGFFVIAPADGIAGDPAGIAVEHGHLFSEATNGRVALILGHGGRQPRIEKLTTSLRLEAGEEARHLVDGINRVPGVIRNCGGVGGDTPTQRPLHDSTCADPAETVVLTPEFGALPPAGPGVEAVLDSAERVVAVRPRYGLPVLPSQTVVQATGDDATWLAEHAHLGSRLHLAAKTTDSAGQPVYFDRRDFVVNAGPNLVTDGRIAVNPDADGLVHADDPSFYYGWVVRRHPRTIAGVDREGRVLLVTVDGRQAGLSEGLTIEEAARVMKALGAVDAVNLDGGGSTAMTVGGALVSSPSDPAGERPVGDAVLVLPAQP